MTLSGKNYIGHKESALGSNTFHALNAMSGEPLEVAFHEATPEEIHEAILLSQSAFESYRWKSGKEKATFLRQIAEEIDHLGSALIRRCQQETALPEARLNGEKGRTMNQLRMFADLLEEGSWVDARIDHAEPSRQPIPKADIRQMQIALGPVGVFGASNFPLAFSVAGGDTASALAAGCPVVVKAHPAHPGTCEIVAQAILSAAQKTNMPEGVFSLLQGASVDVGQSIVAHPAIKAIGFTGSFQGGKALFDAAAKRPEPIPVYAEMGSVNPVFILPGAMRTNKENIASGLAASVTLGVGQFCTNPGLVLVGKEHAEELLEATKLKMETSPAGSMLSSGIKAGYDSGLKTLTGKNQVVSHLKTAGTNGYNIGQPALLSTTATAFLADGSMEDEIFGPATLVVKSDSREDLLKAAQNLHGHLTATIHAADGELEEYADLVRILEQKVGRILINGFPTGVEVCDAMVHGGPFPATTDSRSTSVGTGAINRFCRPVCYQSFPEALLPPELQDKNPLGIIRKVDGEWKRV